MKAFLKKLLAVGSAALFLSCGLLAATVAGEYISDTNAAVVKRVHTSKKVVALTFDDGPHPLTTKELLAVLQAKQVHATFFVLGSSVEKHKALLGNIVAGGHEVANHSYSHQHLNKMPKQEAMAEVEKAEGVICGQAPKPTLFRPPGGGYNDRLVEELHQRGYAMVLWTIDPRDWDRRSVDQVVATVVNKAEPGAIILLHEGQAAVSTPKAVAQIIDQLRAQEYQFVTVGELMRCYEARN